MIRSCKDCTQRHVGCHDTCEKYIKEQIEFKEKTVWLQNENRRYNRTSYMINMFYGDATTKRRSGFYKQTSGKWAWK